MAQYRHVVAVLLLLVLVGGAAPAAASQADAALAARFAGLALDCVHRQYPNKIAHVLNGDEDARPPRELTPAFYGCYDWHSSVGAALLRRRPNQSLRQRGRRQLDPSRRGEGAAEGTGGRRYLCRQRRLGVFRWYSRAWWRVSVRINAPAARGGLRTVATAAKCHRAPVDSHPVAGRMPTGLQGAGDEHRTPHRRCHVDNVEYHCGFQGVRGGAREAVAMVTRRRISTKERSGSRFSAASSGCRPS